MFTINNYNYNCTKECKDVTHADIITRALTKQSVDDKKLAAFIAKTCCNFADVINKEHKSVLQVASSVERYEILQWIINIRRSNNISSKPHALTLLNGFTLLNALQYGNVDNAVLLIKNGAPISSLEDFEFLPSFLYFTPFKTNCYKKELIYGNTLNGEMFPTFWRNFRASKRKISLMDMQKPQQIEVFQKKRIIIVQVSISSIYSLFLSENGDVYMVEHTKDAKLGFYSNLDEPKKINIAMKNSGEKIVFLSAGHYHSLILSNHNIIYSTGLNSQNQSGSEPSPEKLLNFSEIDGLSKLIGVNFKGIRAHDNYSLAHSNTKLFVWGTNVGQFGLKSEIQDVFIKEIEINDRKIMTFASNNSAIVCYTINSYLYVYNKFLRRSYKTPWEPGIITNMLFHGNDSDISRKQPHQLKILILTKTSSLYMWYENSQKFVRCTFDNKPKFPIEKMKKCTKKVVFLSDGKLYKGTLTKEAPEKKYEYLCESGKIGKSGRCKISIKRGKSQLKRYGSDKNKKALYYDDEKKVCDINEVIIKLDEVPFITRRIYDMFLDDNGEIFAALEENSRSYLNVPEWKNNIPVFDELLHQTDEFDSIHDVIFHVNCRKFPSHKFIIANRAPKLYEIIKNYNSKNVPLEYENLTSDLFYNILQFIYTNKCHIEFLNTSEKCLNNYRYFVNLFGIIDYQIDIIKEQNREYPSFDRSFFPELYDVTLLCLNNQEIKAHKCILVSRLEYFNMMFSHTWSETNIINLKSIPLEYMEQIIDYLYSLNFSKFVNENISENVIITMLMICDLFLIEQLKHNFEILLFEGISINSCGEMLEFANAFHCEKLEETIIEYICMNLDRILPVGSLENLEPYLLRKLNVKYREIRNLYDKYKCSQITPDPKAVDDVELYSFVSDFTVDLEMEPVETTGIENNKINT